MRCSSSKKAGITRRRASIPISPSRFRGSFETRVAQSSWADRPSRTPKADALAAAVREAGGVADAVVDVEAAIDHLLAQAEADDLIVVAGTNPVVGRIRAIADEF